MLKNFKEVIYSPALFFRENDQKLNILSPLMLLLISTSAVIFYYFTAVDFSWFVDQIVEVEMPNETAQTKEMFKSISSKSLFISTTLIANAVILMLSLSGLAIYSFVVAKLTSKEKKFRYCFAISCWVFIPFLIFSLIIIIYMLLFDVSQMPIESINLAVIKNFFQIESTNKLFSLISLDVLWSAFLYFSFLVFGLEMTKLKALIFTLLPYSSYILYGIVFS